MCLSKLELLLEHENFEMKLTEVVSRLRMLQNWNTFFRTPLSQDQSRDTYDDRGLPLSHFADNLPASGYLYTRNKAFSIASPLNVYATVTAYEMKDVEIRNFLWILYSMNFTFLEFRNSDKCAIKYIEDLIRAVVQSPSLDFSSVPDRENSPHLQWFS